MTREMANNITVYGLSTEGYKIASMIATKGSKVSIIDESSRLAISLKPDIAKSYPTVNSLIEDEPLLNIEPIDIAISNTAYLFFAPRIRKIGSETKSDVLSKFRDAIKSLKKETSIIYTLPIGIGGNNENIALIEHITGFSVGQDINYYYMPIGNTNTSDIEFTIGTSNKSMTDKKLTKLIYDSEIHNKLNFVSISSAEIIHAIQIVRRYTNMASILEICKFLPDLKTNQEQTLTEHSDLFIDDIANGLYDLRSLSSSLTGSGPLMYLINGTIKSIEGYIKHLINRIREMLKKREIKASRTKVIIAWNPDVNEIRGDKLDLLYSLEVKLKDYIGDVEQNNRISDLYSSERTTIILICSKGEFENITRKNKTNQEVILVKANPICEVIG